GNDFLQSIQSDWVNWEQARNTPTFCACETLPTDGAIVVSMSSATALCNRGFDPMTANHIDMVKPEDRGDPRYTRFASALRHSITAAGQTSPKPALEAGPGAPGPQKGRRLTLEGPR